MKRFLAIAMLINLLGYQSFAQNKAEIKMAINSVVYTNMMAFIGPAFEKKTGIKMVYTNDPGAIYGSHLNFADVVSGKSEVGISAVEYVEWLNVMKKEAPNVKTEGMTNRVVGKDIILIMTNKDVGVTALDDKQLEGIFSGKIKNWKELGGKDQPIVLVLQTVSKSRNAMFKKRILNDKDISMKNFKDTKTNAESADLLRSTPGSISFLPSMGVDTKDLIIQKTSEIGRPFTMITLGKPSENVFKLINFIEKEGRQILENAK